MNNPEATQLPEVDSLPDGFVDGSAEPPTSPTPTFNAEKLVASYKGKEIAGHEFQTTQNRLEGTEKLRTFPVVLTETESYDDSTVNEELVSEASVEQTEIIQIGSTDSTSESLVAESGYSNVQEQVQGEPEKSEKGTLAPIGKEMAPSQNTDTLKNKKYETAETKRKSAKRALKSENEFLEYTLKYQQVIAERDAAIAVRDKLESLCRELQRQNKKLMDECKRVSAEGQNLRLDLSSKFQDAIKGVSNRLEEQKDECLLQLKENEMLRTKLKQLVDQYALSEQQNAQKLKQKTLELQLSDLKIKQFEEKLVQEQSQMKLYAEQVSRLSATENNLRLQLASDGEKFQQFQEALSKRDELFETFKQEIEKMAKSIKEQKKENAFLKTKTERSDFTLIELLDERESLKKQLEKTKNQKEKLESLCRSLQAERKQSSNEIKSSDSVPE